MSSLRNGKTVDKTPKIKDEFKSLFGVSARKRKKDDQLEEENENQTFQLAPKKINLLKSYLQNDENTGNSYPFC